MVSSIPSLSAAFGELIAPDSNHSSPLALRIREGGGFGACPESHGRNAVKKSPFSEGGFFV